MDLVNEADVTAPVLPFEDVACPPLGGAVRVQAMDLEQGMLIEARIAALHVKYPDLGTAAGFPVVAEVLALCVVGRKGAPVYSVQRWRNFGVQHKAIALELFNTAWRLSGMSGEDAKKN
jgi:hypothetical protein